MFCVQCGKETHRLVESQCGSCFLARNKPAAVPREIDVTLCYQCNSRLQGKTWQAPSEDRDEVMRTEVRGKTWIDKRLDTSSVEVVLDWADERNAKVDVLVEGRVADVPFETLLPLRLTVKVAVCPTCSRQSGGYWASLIQLRATDRDPTEHELKRATDIAITMLEAAWRKGNRDAFVTKEGPTKGGYDLFLGDIEVGRQIARAMADLFNTRVEDSAKLFGEKEGKQVFRVTFLVRIPPFKREDVLVTDKGPLLVTNVTPRSVAVIRLTDGSPATVPKEEAEKARVLVAGDHVKEMLIVSVTKQEALLLDPDSGKTHEVRLPATFDYEFGRTHLHAVEVDEQFYVVPTRASAGTAASR